MCFTLTKSESIVKMNLLNIQKFIKNIRKGEKIMKSEYTIIFISPEMIIPELEETALGANFRGGLGILAGDICEGLAKQKIKAIAITPLYSRHWMTKENIDYGKTPAKEVFKAKPLAHFGEASILKTDRAGIDHYGILQKEIFDELYTADRGNRLSQEVLLGHVSVAVIKQLKIKPDIIWIQEGHSSIIVPVAKEDAYFKNTKYLFTTHTPVPEGMEKFFGDRFHELKIHEKYHYVFVKDGVIDMTRASMILADKVNAVSEEHFEQTKKMFPEFINKITWVTNGSSRDLWLSPCIKKYKDINFVQLEKIHLKNKNELCEFLQKKSGILLDIQKPILSWVRRIAWYKQQNPMLAPIIDAICAERNEIVSTPLGRLNGLGFQVFGAGQAHESDSTCLGWMADFHNWMTDKQKGKSIFLPQYGMELLQRAAWGSDVWFSCPLPGMEACGTSEMRATENGVPVLTTYGGGAREYIEEYNMVTGEGNGFFIEPYQPISAYYKLKFISDLYYDYILNGNNRWLMLKHHTFKTGKKLDVLPMIEKYEKIFEELLLK